MEELIHQYGYLGIVLFLVLTGCGLPIPEEVAIIAAGVMAARGLLDPWTAMLACLIGCLLGDSIMYFFGFRLGKRMLRPGSFWGNYLTPEREKTLEHLIHRHGIKVLFISRFLVGVRSPVYLTAGILKYPYRRFIVADFFCASLVIALFFGLSYFYGERVVQFVRDAEYGLTIFLVLLALGGCMLAWFHLRHLRQPHDPGTLGTLLGENEASVEAGVANVESTVALDQSSAPLAESSAPRQSEHAPAQPPLPEPPKTPSTTESTCSSQVAAQPHGLEQQNSHAQEPAAADAQLLPNHNSHHSPDVTPRNSHHRLNTNSHGGNGHAASASHPSVHNAAKPHQAG
jgi:membrane protein DedA with SNARE-associated domain